MEIRDYLSILWKRKAVIIVTTIVALLGGLFINLLILKPMYKASAKILVEQPPRVIMLTEQTQHFNSPLSVETQRRLLKTIPVAQQAAKNYYKDKIKNDEDAKEKGISLINRVSVKADDDTGIIVVTVESRNPEECADISNAYAKAFEEISRNYMDKSMEETLTYLQQQLDVASRTLEQKEKAIFDFNKKHGIVVFTAEMQAKNEALVSFQTKMIEAELMANQYQTQMRALQEVYRDQAVQISSDPFLLKGDIGIEIRELNTSIVNLEVELDTLAIKYKPTHPRIKELQNQIDHFKRVMEERISELVTNQSMNADQFLANRTQVVELTIQYELAKSRAQFISIIIEDLKDAQKKYPELQYKYSMLEREKLVAENLFLLIFEQQQQAHIDSVKRDVKVRVFEEAIAPKKPYKPNRVKNIVVFIVLGFMIGIGLGFLLEEMEETIRTSDDVKNHLNLPVLGSIPYSAETINKLITDVALKSPIAEAYRRLSFFTQLFCLDPPIKNLLITSSKSDEGKSTTMANLAISMAQEGTKVLMVDTDLRRPMLHRMFGVDNSLGISSILTGELEAEIAVSDLSVSGHLPKDSFMEVIVDRLIQPVSIKGLSLIPSGPLPANSIELLRSERMLAFLRCAEKKADIVIFDSPPAIHVIDAVVLSQILDGVLFIINSGRINKEEALQVKYMIESTKTPIIGIALNNIEASSPDYYYYYYYGGYGYGSRQRRKRVKLKR